MRVLYDLGFLLFAAVYIPLFLLSKRKREGLSARFGHYPQQMRRQLNERKNIWVHAVSVGEVGAVSHLVERLKAAMPDHRLVITTVTETGNRIARKIAAAEDIVTYLPFDLSYIVKRAFSSIRPTLLIIAETELWPNLIARACRDNIPVVIVNGRISEKSFKRYRFARWILQPMLKGISLFLMQTADDRDKIISLGADPSKVKVSGNMKFDTDGSAGLPGDKHKRLSSMLSLDADEQLFVAGSTHPGEEEIIISSYTNLKKRFDRLRLLIAPRHIERTDDIERMIIAHGLKPVRFSQLSLSGTPVSSQQPVFILDLIGELRDLYAMAEMVFIGGSLVRKGGQNIIEPAALGKPVIFGPHTFNFRQVVDIFLRKDAALLVKDGASLERAVGTLLEDRDARLRLGCKGREVVEDNRGAADKTLDAVKTLL